MRENGTTLLIGTAKGGFLIRGPGLRGGWEVSGPHCGGWPVNHVIGDPETGILWAGGGGWNGAGVWRSRDGGETWEVTRLTRGTRDDRAADDPDFAALTGWSDGPPPFGDAFSQVWSRHYAHGTLYAGTKPARLLASRDGGRSWQDITEGLPSASGFPIHVHPRDPQIVWTLPLNGGSQGRFPLDAAAAVWKSSDGGQSWQAKREGLPQTSCFFTVLQQAMAGDRKDPAGVYFGTNSGSVFASLDEGGAWEEIARRLPAILPVEVLGGA